MADFLMPSLGADMDAATLVEWTVKPGDTVKRGDVVAVVETDKGAIEIESFEDGVVSELLVEPDAKVPVGTPLARIGDATPTSSGGTPPPQQPVPEATRPEAPVPGTAPETRRPEAPAPAPAPETVPTPAAATPKPTPAATTHGLRASPAAKARARELGIDLSTIQGSGPDGAVVLTDVPGEATRAAAPNRPPAADPAEAMRRAVAAAMSRSKREIPHYYLGTDIDMTEAMAWLEKHNAGLSVNDRVLYAALLIRAVAMAARKYPQFNGTYEGDRFHEPDGIHVGVAVSLRTGGLVAPVIRDADKLNVDEVMAHLTKIVERARNGRLRNSDMAGATITITNLGGRGVPVVYPVIIPPQVAIVGFGRIADRPWVVDGEIAVRPVMNATLAADHRVTDGHPGGLFLRAIERFLAKPHKLEGDA